MQLALALLPGVARQARLRVALLLESGPDLDLALELALGLEYQWSRSSCIFLQRQ